ncbi:zinc finger protein [Spirulina major CS-329]|uniref:zinc finger protein n=1 Tax=Spirulina TaxID=1154 RepID=UPI0023300EF4|nr:MULTISPECIES: zinc finger protein [Spirulina]MDB9496795.1 zinc finger protein [Spirulina subsalsa CS-330]MDB9501539.1 zinc finger protein [Spirulina major CS-329]
MAIREGRWDCPTCGVTGLLGRDRDCQNCGAPRPEGIRFYLPENAAAVQAAEQIAIAKAGADWICDYCGASNRAPEPACVECGAPPGEKRQAVKTYPQPPTSTPQASPSTPQAPTQSRRDRAKSPRSTNLLIRFHQRLGVLRWAFWSGLVSVILVVVIGLLPMQIDATVSQLSWQRSIAVERLTTFTETGWDVPAGGRVLSQQEAIRSYEQVLEGYETRTREVSEQVQVGSESYTCGTVDLGNGYFEDKICTRPVYETRTHTETYEEPIYRDEPVYDTEYTYEIDRWVVNRTPTVSGLDQNPQWPLLELGAQEREGDRTATYTILFQGDNGRDYPVTLDLDTWSQFEPGDAQPLKVTRFGGASLPDE